MKISNKYNIPDATINRMVSDGVISSSWPMYEEVYSLFKAAQGFGRSRQDIYSEIAEKKGISEYTVKAIVLKMDKI